LVSYRVFWLAAGLVLGTIELTALLTLVPILGWLGPEFSEITKGNQIWGFGQWAPMLLLFLPLLSMAEFFYGKSSK